MPTLHTHSTFLRNDADRLCDHIVPLGSRMRRHERGAVENSHDERVEAHPRSRGLEAARTDLQPGRPGQQTDM